MPLVDRSIDEIQALEHRRVNAPTFKEAVILYCAKEQLVRALHNELAEVTRLTRGWSYVPAVREVSLRDDARKQPVAPAF